MSDDLPQGVRLDPRPSPRGAQCVLITCSICGKEVRMLLSTYLAYQRQGIPRRTCSIKCSGIYRRRPQGSRVNNG